AVDAGYAAAGDDRAAGFAEVVRERAGHRDEVGDSRVRRVQRGEPARVRLDARQARGVEAFEAGHAVGAAAALELVERAELARLGGDDDLAAALVGDRVLLAERVELAGPLDAQPGL